MNYVPGDLIKNFKAKDFDFIAHQCNCHTIGGGISGVLIENFPRVLEVHNLFINVFGRKDLYGKTALTDTTFGDIFNLYSQYQPGACSNHKDSFEQRCAKLKECLTFINKEYPNRSIGLPLIASGIAADKKLKKDMSDLEYFGKYIAPIVEKCLPDMKVTIVYL